MANGQILENNQRVLWASESTENTDAVESILTDDSKDIIYQQTAGPVEVTPEGEIIEVDRPRNSQSGVASGFVKGRCSVSFSIPLTAFESEDAQTPHYAPVLKAMNLSEDLSTTGEAHYAPATEQQDSMTMYVYERQAHGDWRLWVVTGIRLTGTFSLETKGQWMLEVEGGGSYTSLKDPATFFDSDGSLALQKDGSTDVVERATGTEKVLDQELMIARSMTATYGGTDQEISSAELDMNWTISQTESVQSEAATVRHFVTRDASGSRIGGGYDLSDYTDQILNDHIDDYEAANEKELVFEASNSEGLINLTAGQVQIGIPEKNASDNLIQWQVPYFLNGDFSDLAGDNDFDLTYKAAP